MVSHSRQQLTLFVPEPWGSQLDALRQTLDPVQASLIAAHVTLCREDELEGMDLDAIFKRISAWPSGALQLAFGAPRRFDGHGVLLPCEHGMHAFQYLRTQLLQDPCARLHGAHLTLAHPRNPRNAGNTDTALRACAQRWVVAFPSVALIATQDSEPWRIVWSVPLGNGWIGVQT